MTARHTLVLRTVAPDMSSRNGFIWPKRGPVECPDWDPTPECGHGLHGLPWGTGDASLIDASEGRVWLVVEVPTDELVDLSGKVKFRHGTVVHRGDRLSATAYLLERAPAGTVCHYASVTAGDRGTATAGDAGTATAGDAGTATAGYGGTATAGDYGGTATAGDAGTATAGYGGTATAGDAGTATAGYGGTATAGDYGTATAGYHGTATAGYGGTATAGYGGILNLVHWDGRRRRIATAYVGEDGIQANVPYRLDERGVFVEAGE